jgi:hypothetical protein
MSMPFEPNAKDVKDVKDAEVAAVDLCVCAHSTFLAGMDRRNAAKHYKSIITAVLIAVNVNQQYACQVEKIAINQCCRAYAAEWCR